MSHVAVETEVLTPTPSLPDHHVYRVHCTCGAMSCGLKLEAAFGLHAKHRREQGDGSEQLGLF